MKILYKMDIQAI